MKKNNLFFRAQTLSQNGFSLIEVLVSVSLVTGLALTLAQVASLKDQINRSASDGTQTSLQLNNLNLALAQPDLCKSILQKVQVAPFENGLKEYCYSGAELPELVKGILPYKTLCLEWEGQTSTTASALPDTLSGIAKLRVAVGKSNGASSAESTILLALNLKKSTGSQQLLLEDASGNGSFVPAKIADTSGNAKGSTRVANQAYQVNGCSSQANASITNINEGDTINNSNGSGVLANGEIHHAKLSGTIATGVLDSITQIIDLPEEGVLIATNTSVAAVMNPHGLGDPQTHAMINIDGEKCAIDRDMLNIAYSSQFYANATCIKKLSKGKHTIESWNSSANVTTLVSHKLQYMVMRSGNGSAIGALALNQ